MKGWFKKEIVFGLIVIVVALVMRLYNFEKGFSFAHDADLYSWIARDINNGHQRLVGQLTSVPGVFIGSFYYYLMAITYKIFAGNPVSAVVPLTIIGLFNTGSIFYIFNKQFGKKVAWIGTCIWAFSWGVASFERWSVPTQPTFTWSIWFLAVILELFKGNLKYLWVYGILVGFTWQLHIALLPVLPIPILGYLLGRNKLIKLKSWQTVLGILAFIISMSPLLLFELKYDFSQVKAITSGINIDAGGPTGWMKLDKVIRASGKEFQVRMIEGWEYTNQYALWFVFILMWVIVGFYKKLDGRISLLIGIWFFMILLAQFVSKRIVSEYYFSNLVPLAVMIVALFLSLLNYRITSLILGLYLAVNLKWVEQRSDFDTSYYYRNRLMKEIGNDVKKNNYNCVAVNYIADPGVGVGFRYLFWYYGIDLVKPGVADVPIYNISIPWKTVGDENPIHSGRYGVLIPEKAKGISKEECQKAEYKIDPLLGYTE